MCLQSSLKLEIMGRNLIGGEPDPYFFSLFGVHWVMPNGVLELLASYQEKFGRCNSMAIWRVIPPLSHVWHLAGEER